VIKSVLIGKIGRLMCPSTSATTSKESSAKESIMKTETVSHNDDHSTGNNDASEAPNLAACTTEALFRWLLVHRFNNNEDAVKAFLTQAASTSSHAHPAAASSQAKDGALTLSSSSSVDLGESLVEKEVEVSCTTPRGKLQFDFRREGIECTDKNGNCMKIPAGAVQHCVIFPKPEDCQPIQRKGVVVTDQILLVFGKDAIVTYKNQKPLSQVCLALPADLPVWKKNASSNEDDKDDDDDIAGLDHTDQYTRFLCKSLSLDIATQIIRVANPTAPTSSSMSTFWRYQFVSHEEQGTSTTTAGMPFVKCYAGVNDGVLYPLQEGLLFFKPPRFVPRSNLQAIACGRGGAGNASRYVDMVLTLADDSTTEFTNIHRSELPVLREYIHGVLIPAMQKDADGGADAKAESPSVTSADAAQQQENEGQEDEDEERVPSGRPGKRKASVEARAVTQRMRLESDDDDDEEGDDDFVAEQNSDDDKGSEEESGDDDDEESEDEDNSIQVEADEATESEDE
jgi:hypothetical protein